VFGNKTQENVGSKIKVNQQFYDITSQGKSRLVQITFQSVSNEVRWQDFYHTCCYYQAAFQDFFITRAATIRQLLEVLLKDIKTRKGTRKGPRDGGTK
jgi:hypothetical protein